jgi:hypothetical protein
MMYALILLEVCMVITMMASLMCAVLNVLGENIFNFTLSALVFTGSLFVFICLVTLH